MASRDHFKGKRIAVIGLGPHGEMSTDIKALIKAGALVAVFDLRAEARVKQYLDPLRELGLANHQCGSVPVEDLLDMDQVVLSHEYPRESTFLKAVRDKGIPIDYAESLFFRLAPPVTIVGVMGTAGKSTVMSVLAPMLEAASEAFDGQNFFSIDPESDEGALAHLRKVKSGDLVVARMPVFLMKELYALRMSPHVAVFTTMPPEGSYAESPFEALEFQTYNNFIVASDEIIDSTRKFKSPPRAKMLRTKPSLIPADWPFAGRSVPRGLESAALALQAARLFKLSDDQAREILAKWKPLKGRLELVKKAKGVEIYNDGASVHSCSTEAAVETLADGKNLVLVFGGAQAAGCDYRRLYELLPKHVHTVVLLPGSGTLKERQKMEKLEGVGVHSAPSLEEAARIALERANKGDRIVFSPGFEAGGLDRSRRERSERFVRALRGL